VQLSGPSLFDKAWGVTADMSGGKMIRGVHR
jgi:hypothetical protein